MNIRLKLLEIYVPVFFRKKKLIDLFRLTTDAFECELPVLRGFTYIEMLKSYAELTQREAASLLKNKNLTEINRVRTRLFENAKSLGYDIRRLLEITTLSEAVRSGSILYKFLKIHFRSYENATITISHCFFSRFYTPEICRFISALDEGLMYGLSDGYYIKFTSRITEGAEVCRMHLLGTDKSAETIG